MTMEFEAEAEPRAVRLPGWYRPVAAACLLFEIVGCYAYVTQVTTDVASLPVDQRRLWEATPWWTVAAYAIAVWVGLAGAVGLLLRKRFARPALTVSLLFVLIQFGGLMLIPQIRGSMSSDQLLGPLLIILLAYAFWQFARTADRHRWLGR